MPAFSNAFHPLACTLGRWDTMASGALLGDLCVCGIQKMESFRKQHTEAQNGICIKVSGCQNQLISWSVVLRVPCPFGALLYKDNSFDVKVQNTSWPVGCLWGTSSLPAINDKSILSNPWHAKWFFFFFSLEGSRIAYCIHTPACFLTNRILHFLSNLWEEEITVNLTES